ncbi:MAG: hypothetical protein AABX14_01435 [Candidatus Aenigmatarchaeota archaeon]
MIEIDLNIHRGKANMEMITIPKAEYKRLKEIEKVDKELLEDITQGIKDVVSGKVKEV